MLLIFLTFLFLLIPQELWAWGPGVHMAIGNHVLGHVHLFAPELAALLAAYPERFLYGCLSADIFIGKGCRFTPTHSHNWDTGRTLLRQAASPEVAAYAYGYLSHLAADVIAHNYLVPNMLGFAASRGKVAHTYMEMLADLQVEWPQKQGSRLFGMAHKAEDRILLSAVAQKKLPFVIKKQIFRQSLHLVEKRPYKPSLRMVQHLLPFARQDALITQAIDFARELVMDLLRNPQHSPVLECDPIGTSNLDQVRHFRRKQRHYYTRHGQGIIFPLDTRLATCLKALSTS